MAQQRPTITFEDIPLDQARVMGRGPRMDSELYQQLRERLQSLGTNTAMRMSLPEETSPTTMKKRVLHVAAEMNIPVTIRKVPGGLLFWRSSSEDLKQAREIAQRLQPARKPPPTTRRGRPRRA